MKEKDEGKYFKFLGVLLDSKLTWKHHITQLTKSLSSILFLLRRIAHTTPIEVSRTAYMSLFQSKLSYGQILWGNSTVWQKVFVIKKSNKNNQQTKAFRHLQNEFSRSSNINLARVVYISMFDIYKGYNHRIHNCQQQT